MASSIIQFTIVIDDNGNKKEFPFASRTLPRVGEIIQRGGLHYHVTHIIHNAQRALFGGEQLTPVVYASKVEE